jgi:nucleotide-binding universal stress UspA family protein
MFNRELFVLISKVLVGFDGTECALRALDFGLDLADKYSASITILNVLELPIYGNPEDPLASSVGMAGIVNDIRKAHQEMLSKAAAKAASVKPVLNISTEIREGNPPNQIVGVAAEGSFDIVVMGHGSAGRILEMFLGGTSERVAHLAKCAVLIVK